MNSKPSTQTAEIIPLRKESGGKITQSHSRGERYREYERWEKSEINSQSRGHGFNGWAIAFLGLFAALGVSALGMFSTYLFNPPQYIREAREAQQQLAAVQKENQRIKQCIQGI